MEYTKPWLSIDEQIDSLTARGVTIADQGLAEELLRTVGYYRLTGYLYPFRQSEPVTDLAGRIRTEVLSAYRPGTSIEQAAALIGFDRQLRLLVLDGVERIEVALRTQLGHTIGRVGSFAHEDPITFVRAFTDARVDQVTGAQLLSRHGEWLRRVRDRQDGSDEAFVAHFREKYEDRMPIWALTEILELGQIARLYSGLRNDLATEIASAVDVPTKRLLESWIVTVNYIRNIAAHHARLFNRKLVIAPKRPGEAVPLLAHLSHGEAPKEFGVYSALAVMAYLVRAIDPTADWPAIVAEHLREFPATEHLDAGSMGIAGGWLDEPLWHR